MAVGQALSELNDGGIVVGQLLMERDRLAEFGASASDGLPNCGQRNGEAAVEFASRGGIR